MTSTARNDSAESYLALGAGRILRETAPPAAMPEIEWQARWFAGDFGRRFRSVTGDEIEIVQFGTWNCEAGPDFSDAVIRLNGGDAVRGTIEFDLADRSWETHGHSTNSAFDDAVLHVFVQQSGRVFFAQNLCNLFNAEAG